MGLEPLKGTISGYVTDAATGRGVVGASVEARNASGLVGRTTTSGNGLYSLPEVTTSIPVTVGASGPNYSNDRLSTTTLTVPAGASATANLQLQPNPGRITGRAVDVATGAPLGPATVTMYDLGGNRVAVTSTDGDGNYVLQPVPAGSYSLLFSVVGYSARTYPATVDPGASALVNASLAPLPDSVVGSVTDALSGRPIPGVLVQLLTTTGTPVATAVSDSIGEYAFTGVAPGTYAVTASNPNYTTGPQGTASIAVTGGRPSTQVLTLSPKPGTILGSVTNATTGEAIPGASLQLFDVDSDPVAATTSGAAAGVFSFTNVAAAVYRIEATAPNYARGSQAISVAPNQTAIASLALPPTAGAVSGLVMNALTGELIQGAAVQLRDSRGELLATSSSHNAGAYLLAGAPAQISLSVVASAPNYTSTVASSVPVTVPVGGSATAILQLKPNPSTLSGIVRDALTGAPLAGAMVQVYDESANLVATALADTSGAYTVQNLVGCDFTIAAAKSGYLPSSASVVLGPGRSTTQNIALSPAASSIGGVTTDSLSGKGVAGARIQLFDASGTVTMTTLTDAAGSFVFAGVPQGSFTVLASHADYTATVGSSVKVAVVENVGAWSELTLLPRSGAIAGTVVDATTGVPIPGATITVQVSSGAVPTVTQTDRSGQFSVFDVPPGVYTATIGKDGYADLRTQVVVAPNRSTTSNVALSPSTGLVGGSITSSGTGEPIAGATVRVLDPSVREVASTKSGSAGGFAIAGLPPGSYTISADHPDFSSASESVTLVSGEPVRRDLRLSPKASSIEVVVLDAGTGLPTAGATVRITSTAGFNATLTPDASGRATLRDVPPGTYLVTTGTPGYATRTLRLVVGPNRVVVVDSRMSYRIDGTVVDLDTLQPIERAVVAVTDGAGNPAGSATTNDEGRFQLDVTSTGSYVLSAAAAGYDPSRSNPQSALVSASAPEFSARLTIGRYRAPYLALRKGSFRPQVTATDWRGAAPGDLIGYSLTFENLGTAAARRVVITENLPATTTFVGPAGWQEAAPGAYRYEVGDVPAGTSGEVRFIVRRDAQPWGSDPITNTASIRDDGTNGVDLSGERTHYFRGF